MTPTVFVTVTDDNARTKFKPYSSLRDLPEPVPASCSIELVLELMIGPIQPIGPYDE